MVIEWALQHCTKESTWTLIGYFWVIEIYLLAFLLNLKGISLPHFICRVPKAIFATRGPPFVLFPSSPSESTGWVISSPLRAFLRIGSLTSISPWNTSAFSISELIKNVFERPFSQVRPGVQLEIPTNTSTHCPEYDQVLWCPKTHKSLKHFFHSK